MDVVVTPGAGLAVHTKRVLACRITPDPTEQQAEGVVEVQAFGTLTVDLLALADWLAAASMTHVAMERTGAYWKPGVTLLEGTMHVCLVTARHVKRVPERTTDNADVRGRAKLMCHGWLQASCMPPAGQCDGRGGTRDRIQGVQERRRDVNRGPGMRERAQITRASVATEMMGGRVAPAWPPWSRAGRTPPPWWNGPNGGGARSRSWSTR
jgi:transposase